MSFSMRNITVYIVTARRSGIAALMAMLYLAIFATMAVSFYATTNTQAIIAHSENDSAYALAAAESGSEFMRYQIDRKSTRLNSSHVSISYAVFCLKKK